MLAVVVRACRLPLLPGDLDARVYCYRFDVGMGFKLLLLEALQGWLVGCAGRLGVRGKGRGTDLSRGGVAGQWLQT